MMVMSVGDSSRYTFNDLLFSILNSNINLIFEDAERIQHMEAIAESYPGVVRAEMWAFGGGTGHESIAGGNRRRSECYTLWCTSRYDALWVPNAPGTLAAAR